MATDSSWQLGISRGTVQAQIRREEGGGSGTQKFVCQQWPDQIFLIVNFVFFPRWSLWSGGGVQGGGVLLWLLAVLM